MLEGVTVLDTTHHVAGPFCTKLLAESGAEAIKVERPKVGDPARSFPPFFRSSPDIESSALFFYLNTGKKSVTINLKQEAGQEIFRDLVKHSDILVENFSPRVMPSLGLDYVHLKEINPHLVMVSISNFGQFGPYKDWKSSELVTFAISGVSYSAYGLPGLEPIKPYGSVAQHMAGLFGAVSAMIAYYCRKREGFGQYVDISMMDAVASLEEHSIPMAAYEDKIRQRSSRHPSSHPNSVFPCKDGYVYFAVSGARQWQTLCAIAGFPNEWASDESPFLRGEYRKARADEIDAFLAPWLISKTKQELQELSFQMLFPSAPIKNISEVTNDPQHMEREFFSAVEHPYAGKIQIPGVPFKVDSTRTRQTRAPMLGEHNKEIFSHYLNYSTHDLAMLGKQGTI